MRIAIVTVAALIVLWGLVNFPLERYARAPLIIRPASETPVFVTVPGSLQPDSLIASGRIVASGETVALLTNLELEGELLRLEGNVERLARQLEVLESRRTTSREAADRIPTVRASLADARQRLDDRRRDLQGLTISAPRGGMVWPVPRTAGPSPSALSPEGHSLDPRNSSAWLSVGTPLCVIGDPIHREAILYVDQPDVGWIQPGQRVELTTPQTGGRRLQGKVTRIAPRPATEFAPSLLVSGAIPVQLRGDGVPVPVHPVHEVRAQLDEGTPTLIPQQQGAARMRLGSETLAIRILRFLRRTFTFDI